jgi:tetratricopeptide (TPR) repeat protein
MLSLMGDQIIAPSGPEPEAWPSKLINLLFHAINTSLLFLLLNRLGLSRFQCFVPALVFGIHPLQVSSVAWIAERKNLLCALFYLLSMLTYMYGLDSGKRWPMVLCLFIIILGLLSKPAAVTIPVSLLAYRLTIKGWKGFTRWDAAFFIVSLLIVTGWGLFVIHTENTYRWILPPIYYRPLIATTAICFYLYKFMIPLDLVAIYPRWDMEQDPILFLIPFFLVLAGILAIIYFRRRINRIALFGFIFFLINLSLVSGFVPFSYMQFSFVADHFIYLPMIGLSIVGAILLGALFRRIKLREGALAHTAWLILIYAWLGALAVVSVSQTYIWSDPVALWESTLKVNPNAVPALHNYAREFIKVKQYDKALELLNRARALAPGFYKIYHNMGWIHFLRQNDEKALQYLDISIRLNPADTFSHRLAALSAWRTKGPEAALERLERAAGIIPDSADLRYEMGRIYLQMDRLKPAMKEFRTSSQLDPLYSRPRLGMAEIFLRDGNYESAMEEARIAAELGEGAPAYNLYGVAAAKSGDLGKAFSSFTRAYQLDPDLPEVVDNLAKAITNLGEPQRAALFCKENADQGRPCSKETISIIDSKLNSLPTTSNLGPDSH